MGLQQINSGQSGTVSCPHCNVAYGFAAFCSSRLKNRGTDVRWLDLVIHAVVSFLQAAQDPSCSIHAYCIHALECMPNANYFCMKFAAYRCLRRNSVGMLHTSSSFVKGIRFKIRILVRFETVVQLFPTLHISASCTVRYIANTCLYSIICILTYLHKYEHLFEIQSSDIYYSVKDAGVL
jgi:hypothetical protein